MDARKKNIALIIPQLYAGGAERVVSRISFLLEYSFNVHIFLFDAKEINYEYAGKLDTINVPGNVRYNFFIRFINIIKRVRKIKDLKRIYDIEYSFSFGNSANYINVLSKQNDKIITSIRGYARIKFKNTFYDSIKKYFFNFIFKKSDKIVCVSKVMQYEFLNVFNISPKKVTTIYNGYNVSNIRLLSKEPVDKDDESIFDGTSKVIISAGTIRREKGLWHLVKAFHNLYKIDRSLKLVILGRDYLQYGYKLKELINDLDLNESIYLLGFKNNPYRYIAKSNLYVMPSLSEGFPNSLVEAMICGIPVISSNCKTGPSEILTDKENFECSGISYEKYGVLIPAFENTEDYSITLEKNDYFLSEAMNELLTNKDLIENYSKKSLEGGSRFSFDIWKDELSKLFSE